MHEKEFIQDAYFICILEILRKNILNLLERATQAQDFVKDSMYSKYLPDTALTAYYKHDQEQK